jgi:uncharacterized protein YdiU (UPF0061 family)
MQAIGCPVVDLDQCQPAIFPVLESGALIADLRVMLTAPQADTLSVPHLPFDNSYARLPDRFFVRLAPTPVKAPRLIRLNAELARHLGLDPAWLGSPEGVQMLAGNLVPEGSTPLAMAYAGHQFGNWVPQLGDGRAILLGEVIDADGIRRDIQLKGAGRTPFSRGGDGRAVLGPVLREYIVSEAMAALGVPTTRALAAVTTGEHVWREAPEQGAVLTRVAKSHIRIGTFEFFANRGDVEGTRALADYVIARHYPEVADAENPYRALLDAVIGRVAALVAQWLHIGFIHGVMNTDNMSIAGETIDYGPCAFMDEYHPAKVFSSIDANGRYAYANQPRIAHWNLSRLAGALLPLIDEDREKAVAMAQSALDIFPARFEEAYVSGFRRKLGLAQIRDEDADLLQDLLDRMAENEADFTLTFRRLSDAAAGGAEADARVGELFADPAAFTQWVQKWRQRLAAEDVAPADRAAAMKSVNPAFIPRNHRIQAIITAAQTSDFKPFEALNAVLSKPYSDQPEFAEYRDPPQPDEVVHRTFCGT